ncbi:hypothetical protein EMIHUDRAFT_467857 [Emiliania huxleyi CCMP1516]|uniref:Calcium-dependent protein kinase n=2 Tax=Emiliania huxleyi TaxID=2903 RepID=A0A0D3KBC0_EMIH1|nr:hypothetical protein EMIHUDRAFT_467857 [Emiliania huxleyi CCMP1516]EOD33055.1 hypothetical protein EMIHUDRAFT_467857 [Emiliania huxleyi CCMP1516]|eukprot:XP_005785484.1 hypothetical protein EMIHUDRAFT_467857 [Emiliania huxleyi CCMP1516]
MGACGSRTGGDGGATSDRPYNSTEKGPRGILGKGFHDVTIDYNLGVELGKGTFGVVRKATCAKTDESFACKSIAKRRLRTKAEREMIKREVEIQHHLGGHSGIVNIVEAVEDRKHECSGGELFDRILSKGIYSEADAAATIRDIVEVAIRMMAASMAPEEVAGLRELFSAADVNDDGTISVLELRDIMQKPGYAGIGEESSILASVEKLNALLNEADVDGSGNLDLEEFIAATVHTSKLYKEEKLRDTFDKFDVDGSGFLSREEIKAALNERGLNEAGLQGIFEEVDTNNDGKVDYDEFCSLMRAGDPVCSGTGMRSSIRFSFTSD